MHVTADGRITQPTRKWYSRRETEAIYAAGGHVVLKLERSTDMTAQFTKSQIVASGIANFDQAVADFVEAKKNHVKTVNKAAPTAHHLVEAAVRRVPGAKNKPDDFLPDYRVIDDMPAPTLEEKRAALAHKVSQDAAAVLEKAMPRLKTRLFTLQAQEALTKKPEDHTPADKALIAEHEARQKKHTAVLWHVAQLESEIADLDADQVDVWKGAPFPEI